jgi:DNA-binding MarR family transcriptional regulator
MHKVVELVKQWETFDKENEEGSLADFCRWYLQQQIAPNLSSSPQDLGFSAANIENMKLGVLLGRIELLLQFYARKAMQPLPIKNFEEFRYLGILFFMGEVRKSELIYHSLLDFSTGTHLINRLIKNGWVEETEDNTDGRAKIVKLSATGMQIQAQLRPQIMQIFGMLFGSISSEDKNLIIKVLSDIDTLHSSFFMEFKHFDIKEILERVQERK